MSFHFWQKAENFFQFFVTKKETYHNRRMGGGQHNGGVWVNTILHSGASHEPDEP